MILFVENGADVTGAIATAITQEEPAPGSAARRGAPRIVLLDFGTPDGPGMDLVRQVAAMGRQVVVVSGPAGAQDRIAGGEAASTLPEMAALLQALLQTTPAAEGPVEMAEVQLDARRMRLTHQDGREERLTGAEAGLLELLARRPGELVERDAVAEHVMGRRLQPQQRGVDQLASTLRQKLTRISAGRIELASVRGRGYRLVG